jgi:hypothetical protein
MNITPFGEVLKDRVELSIRYKLLEQVNGIWRLTQKCKSNYDSNSYIYYLRGSVEKPERITVSMYKEVDKKLTPQQEIKTNECQQIIDEILKL